MDIKSLGGFVLLCDLSQLVGDSDGHILVQTIGDDVIPGGLALNAGSDGLGRLDLHLFSDHLDAVLRDRAEDAWEDQGVVDLVLEVASAASVDPCA